METDSYHERYHRQELIQGWEQKKLSNARVGIISGGCLGEFVSLGLTALGIGEIRILTNEKKGKSDFSFLDKLDDYSDYRGSEKAKVASSILKKINTTIEIIGIHSQIVSYSSFVLFNNPDVIVDATNSRNSKLLCVDYSKKNTIPFISLSAGYNKGIVDVNPDDKKLEKHFEYNNESQNPIISSVLSGFAIDEIRKILLPLNKNDKVCTKSLVYNLAENDPFGGLN